MIQYDIQLIGIAVLILVVLIAIYFVTIYNGLLSAKNNIKKNWANIDVLMVQRNKELPELVAVCKQYMKYEASVLSDLTRLRTEHTEANKEASLSQLNRCEGTLQQKTKELFALAEEYPNLKTNPKFVRLQERVSDLETSIADRREFYNESVTLYNIRLRKIPDIFVAVILGFKKGILFEY